MKRLLSIFSLVIMIGFTATYVSAKNHITETEFSKGLKSVSGYNPIQENGELTIQLCNGGSFTVNMRKVVSITPAGYVCNNEPVIIIIYNE